MVQPLCRHALLKQTTPSAAGQSDKIRRHLFHAGENLIYTNARFANTGQPYGRTKRKFADGKNRVAVQAARLHFSIVRDLRRHQRLLGLRPARRGTQAQRQGTLVERHDPPARRCGRPGSHHHHVAANLEGQRPRGHVQRPDVRLQKVQEARFARIRYAKIRDLRLHPKNAGRQICVCWRDRNAHSCESERI